MNIFKIKKSLFSKYLELFLKHEDNNDNEIEMICYNPDGSVYSKNISIYNEKRDLISEEFYIIFEKSGNIIEELQYIIEFQYSYYK